MTSFHVLIADPDDGLCQELSALVESAGYRVDCMTSRGGLDRALRELQPHALILGVSLNEPGGLNVVRHFETARLARKVPVVIISDRADLEYELLDAFDFLTRPVDELRLLEDLAQLKQNRSAAEAVLYPPMGEEDLSRFQTYLTMRSGLHFDQRNLRLLESGMHRRMRAVSARDYRDYLTYLQQFGESRQELKKLLGLLTIGETYFFRYLAHYEALRREIIPQLMERNRHSRTLRIWSAGCSTGEEPYSLAMLLLYHFPQLAGWHLHILATDINQQALVKAEQGRYGPRALRLTEPALIEKYFRREGTEFVLGDQIRRHVAFRHLNLHTGTYPDAQNGTENLDIIFCRNVMIYFRPATSRKVVERFSRCLRDGGYLFLGHAETLLNLSADFERVTAQGGFFYRLGAPAAKQAPVVAAAPVEIPRAIPPEVPAANKNPSPAGPVAQTAPPAPSAPVDPALLCSQAWQAFEREDFGRAEALFGEVLSRTPQHVDALVGQGFLQANRGAYQAALAACERALQIDDLCPQIYLLRGLICAMEEDSAGAAEEYRKALLLDMSFIMPHYYLSRIFSRQGRSRDARRELRNTLRLLESLPDETLVPYSGGADA